MGRYPSGSKEADCKSVGVSLRRFDSFSAHHYIQGPVGQRQSHMSQEHESVSSNLTRTIFCPGSPIGRGKGLKILTVWVRIPFGVPREHSIMDNATASEAVDSSSNLDVPTI